MATAELEKKVALPVPVLEYPHWRVRFQPNRYLEDRIPSLARCVELVQQNKISLRGWDFPHLSHRKEETHFGPNYIASWTTFLALEYWRLYQSGQFLHLSAVREIVNEDWRVKLKETARSHLSHVKKDWDDVPGFFSLLNFIYQLTEIFEFAARLCEKGVYTERVTVTIELKGVKGFALMADPDRSWSEITALDEDGVGRSWTLDTSVLLADSAEQCLKAAVWFFERFHWLNPPLESLRREQEAFLRGLV